MTNNLNTPEVYYRALRAVKAYLVEHGIENSFFPHYLSWEKATFAENLLPEDNGFDWQKFFHYREKAGETVNWLKITSYDRLIVGKHARAIVKALTDNGFSVSVHHTFKWDRLPDGSNKYVPGWEFFILAVEDNKPISENLVKKAQESIPVICMSQDKRADSCVFHLLDKAGEDKGNCSYWWTPTGFIFNANSSKQAFGVKRAFSDCDVKVYKKKGRMGRRVIVNFPM